RPGHAEGSRKSRRGSRTTGVFNAISQLEFVGGLVDQVKTGGVFIRAAEQTIGAIVVGQPRSQSGQGSGQSQSVIIVNYIVSRGQTRIQCSEGKSSPFKHAQTLRSGQTNGSSIAFERFVPLATVNLVRINPGV